MFGLSIFLNLLALRSLSSDGYLFQSDMLKHLSPYSSILLKFWCFSRDEKSLILFLSKQSSFKFVISLIFASKYTILLNEISSTSRFTRGLKTQTETKLQYYKLRYFWSGAELFYLQKHKTQFPKISRNDFNANPVLTQNELLKESGFKVLKMIKQYPEAKELLLQEQQDVLFNTYIEQPLLSNTQNVKSNREIKISIKDNKVEYKSALKHEDMDLTEQDLIPSKNNSWYGQNKRTVRQLSEIVHRENFSVPTRDRDCEDSDYYYHYTDYSDDERHNQ
ncbi:Hypothetical_protein [Hexamita inflata]|uniref:Hypothetical_protein n=1 Tax=Hexamita inflata TaxID=28002 RepID=A0AA86S5N7_9EUKA|nr:Hypothetical protein HINF_LOCUS66130 [Hexamita inflata]